MSIEPARNEIYLWDTPLSVAEAELSQIERNLPAGEHEHASQFSHAGARSQYVVSRGKLRELLSRYVGTPASDLELVVEGDGKPVLARPRRIEFNLSHSGDIVVYAVAQRAVGIDVEQVRPMARAVELARRFLSREEHEIVSAASPDDRDRGFLSMWVKREASAKAIGTSLWRALGDPGPLNAKETSSGALKIEAIDYSDSYVVAVAARGNDWRVIRCGTF